MATFTKEFYDALAEWCEQAMKTPWYLLVLVFLLMPSLALAKRIERQLMTAVSVATTGSATSSALDIREFDGIAAIWVECTSVAGTADVKIERSDSIDNSIYTDFDDYTDLSASTLSDFASTPEGRNWLVAPVFTGKWAKFRLTGVASNPSDTLCSLWAVVVGAQQ